jgi:hypothetical protein
MSSFQTGRAALEFLPGRIGQALASKLIPEGEGAQSQ